MNGTPITHLYFDQTFVYENEYYLIDGIKVFPAMEVDIKEVGHINRVLMRILKKYMASQKI
ncbi:hypothetical protein BK130_11590 [Viridibacillus sp. FSL H8-0123]|nr:hypothetical protein BK130_11590 [Viridibacillus sp. FSL H8-0123]